MRHGVNHTTSLPHLALQVLFMAVLAWLTWWCGAV